MLIVRLNRNRSAPTAGCRPGGSVVVITAAVVSLNRGLLVTFTDRKTSSSRIPSRLFYFILLLFLFFPLLLHLLFSDRSPRRVTTELLADTFKLLPDKWTFCAGLGLCNWYRRKKGSLYPFSRIVESRKSEAEGSGALLESIFAGRAGDQWMRRRNCSTRLLIDRKTYLSIAINITTLSRKGDRTAQRPLRDARHA